MVSKNDVFPSKYLKPSDLKNGPEVGKISVAVLDDLKGFSGTPEKKLVVYFQRKLKPLILNRTNWDSIADLYGDESDNWPGCEIEVYATTVPMNGQEKDTIRIRKPSARAKKASPPPRNEMSDAVPDFVDPFK
jgi:hypothetical protein